jgi:hypothetical protein
MSEDFTQQVQAELARVSALPLEEQPAAFAAVRDLLEKTLNSDALGSDSNDGSSN